MIVLCLGTMSSGSTWVFNAARMIAARNSRKSVSFFCEDIEAFVRNFEPVDGFNIVKCHRLDERLLDLAVLLKARVIFTSRDPRDCAVSLVDRFSYGVGQIVSTLSSSYATRMSMPREIEVLDFRYDADLRFSAENVSQIADFMGTAIDAAAAAEIATSFSRDSVADRVRTLATYEQDTHWHPNHVGDGLSGKFFDRLDAGYRKIIEEAIMPLDQADRPDDLALFWSPDIFCFDAEVAGERTCVVKCNGKARPLVWGPEYRLPVGRWKIQPIVKSVDRNIRIRVELISPDPANEAVFCNIYSIDDEGSIDIYFDNFYHSKDISIRISSIEDGRFGFFEFLGVNVTFGETVRRFAGGLGNPIRSLSPDLAIDAPDTGALSGKAGGRHKSPGRKPESRKSGNRKATSDSPKSPKPGEGKAIATPIRLTNCPQLLAGGEWTWTASADHANACISEGFYPVETDGAWLAGANGAIDIPVGGAVGEMIRIDGEIVFSFFRGIIELTPAVMLYVNGVTSAAVLHLAGDEPFHRLRFSSTVAAGETCQLRLECSHAASAQERGLGDDNRIIGLILHSIEVTGQSVFQVGEGEWLQIWGIGDTPLEISRTEEQRNNG